MSQRRYARIGCVVMLCCVLVVQPLWGADATLAVASQGPVDQAKLDSEIAAAMATVKTYPTNPAAHARLGSLLLSKGALDEAIRSFDEAIVLNPRFGEAKTGKGVALARKGDLAKAEQVLRESLAHNPDTVRTHYELGLIYERMGDRGRAVAEFKEGIRKHQQGRK